MSLGNERHSIEPLSSTLSAHRIIAGHALPQPDDLLQAQELLQIVLDLLAGEVRVARRVQQRLLRRDQRPAAVAYLCYFLFQNPLIR